MASLQVLIRNEEAGIGVDKEAEEVEPSGRRSALVLGEGGLLSSCKHTKSNTVCHRILEIIFKFKKF